MAMRALVFDVTIPRYLLARSLGRVTEAATFGPLGGLRMREVPDPPLPGPDWARLRILSGGICGTDLATLSFTAATSLEPFGSFPAVPGHEILARVEEVGAGVRGLEPGTRVVVDPLLSCFVRGHPAEEHCPSCREGRQGTCEMAGEEGTLEVKGRPLRRGLTIGYHADLPGGWGDAMVAHRSQLFPVPDELDDRSAVLVEPLSIGMHAVLNAPPKESHDVLVIGSGPIAMGTIWALRATGFRGTVVSQAKREHEARLARSLGAAEVVAPGFEARQALVETGAMAYQPIVGDEVFSGGGFPLVFDCVGSPSALDQALRFTAPRGRIVMLGCAATIPKLDLTFLWAREIEMRGFVGYGRERWRGEEKHTFQVTQELLVETAAPVRDLVTHVFPLDQYRTALSAAANHRRSEAVKVVLEP
jgi:L-iditol 2-dehydrogenase